MGKKLHFPSLDRLLCKMGGRAMAGLGLGLGVVAATQWKGVIVGLRGPGPGRPWTREASAEQPQKLPQAS